MSDAPDEPEAAETREEWAAAFKPVFDDIRQAAEEEGKTPAEVAGSVLSEVLLRSPKPAAVLRGLVILEMIPIKLPPEFEK